MEKIVDGILFEGHRIEDAWEVRTWRANGVMERSARQCVEWREVGPVTPPMTREEYLAFLHDEYGHDPVKLKKRLKELAQEDEDRKARSLKKSAQRAKQACRRAIITEGFDELMTLTYRENQLDRELCKKHFKEWVRRMKRALCGDVQTTDEDGVITTKWQDGQFRYCASFERQERGSMHVHIATHKLPQHARFKGTKVKAWQVGTKIWRAIVGENNGLCFVGGKTRFGGVAKVMGLAKMASYVSKYIMKDYEDAPVGSNRYSRSVGAAIAKPEVLRLTQCTLLDLMILTFEQSPGDTIISHRVGHWKDSMWLCVDGGRPCAS